MYSHVNLFQETNVILMLGLHSKMLKKGEMRPTDAFKIAEQSRHLPLHLSNDYKAMTRGNMKTTNKQTKKKIA